MTKQTTKRVIETPEGRSDYIAQLKRERDTLRSEVDRLNMVIRYKDMTIHSMKKENEKISDELSKARNK